MKKAFIVFVLGIILASCENQDPGSEKTPLTKQDYIEAFREAGIPLSDVQFGANDPDDPKTLNFKSKEELIEFLKKEKAQLKQVSIRSQEMADSLNALKKK